MLKISRKFYKEQKNCVKENIESWRIFSIYWNENLKFRLIIWQTCVEAAKVYGRVHFMIPRYLGEKAR
jgi:hypothetical protein